MSIIEKRTKNIEAFLDEHSINICVRLPEGTYNEVMNKFGYTRPEVNTSLNIISKKHKEIEAEKVRTIPNYNHRTKFVVQKSPTMENPMREICREKGLMRASNKESEMCKIMCREMIDGILFPKGGSIIFIGTGGPFFAPSHENNKLLITDNFEVMAVGRMTTETNPTVVIGNAMSEQKAICKAEMIKGNSSTHRFRTICDRVDYQTIKEYGGVLARQNKIAKMIIWGSGSWESSQHTEKKYPYNFNFKNACEELVAKYSNLYIMALVMINHHSFGVRYLHQNINELILK